PGKEGGRKAGGAAQTAGQPPPVTLSSRELLATTTRGAEVGLKERRRARVWLARSSCVCQKAGNCRWPRGNRSASVMYMATSRRPGSRAEYHQPASVASTSV